MSLEIQISSSLLLHVLNICEQTPNLFLQVECFLELFFYQNHAWKLGVRLIHECGLYTSLYGTSKVPFTVYFMLKASQLLHHWKSPSSWLFIITQPDTNHSLGRLANLAQVLPSLKLCSSFANLHVAILQETHKPMFTQAENKTNNVHPGRLQYVF